MNKITIKQIDQAISQVKPYIQMHGGDVEVLEYSNGIVTVYISGACAHCSLADLTYNRMLGELLKEKFPEIKDIKIKK